MAMTSRSFKPASYLASATTPSRSPRQRPTLTRSSSGGSAVSIASIASEDGAGLSLGLSRMSVVGENGDGGGNEGAECTKPRVTSSPVSQKIDDTPGRKRSQPISIELPTKIINTQAYTPLSARGDLVGGYFPNHESPTKQYRSHPFPSSKKQIIPDSPVMSASSSTLSSPVTEDVPRMASAVFSPSLFGPMSPTIPEPLLKPMGKYHPANYQPPSTSSTMTSTNNATASMANLSIPSMALKRGKGSPSAPTGHDRKPSDVKRKLIQYQRDMIAQARSASMVARKDSDRRKEPGPPKLLPKGSPGPITPLELENGEEGGYIVAGARARSGGEGTLSGSREASTGLGITPAGTSERRAQRDMASV